MAIAAARKIEAVETYIAGYANRNIDEVMSIFAENVTVEDPVGTPALVGKAAVRDFMSVAITMRATLRLRGEIRCAGDFAAFPFVVALDYHGRNTEIEVIDIFQFNDQGEVTEMRAFFGPDNIRVV